MKIFNNFQLEYFYFNIRYCSNKFYLALNRSPVIPFIFKQLNHFNKRKKVLIKIKLKLIIIDDVVLIQRKMYFYFNLWIRGPAEPVHCLAVYNSELITGTTANRIGVHTSIDSQASFSSTKLRSDAFKGILTSMTVLPLNKLLLLGADNGNISLLC